MSFSRQNRLYNNPKTPGILQIFYLSNIMLRQILPTKLSTSLWHEINQSSAKSFLTLQTKILNFMINNLTVFNKYFAIFYRNHLCLYYWYLLARENQSEMKEYIYFDLLSKTMEQYYELSGNYYEVSPKFLRTSCKQNVCASLHQKYNEKTTLDHIGLSRKNRLELIEKTKNVDYHQLFVKTFQACKGQKYLNYDFEKHARGQKQRYSYNKFIRKPKSVIQKYVNSSFLLTGVQQNSQFIDLKLGQKTTNDSLKISASANKLKELPKKFCISRIHCKKDFSLHH